jgi:hypothetical protein
MKVHCKFDHLFIRIKCSSKSKKLWYKTIQIKKDWFITDSIFILNGIIKLKTVLWKFIANRLTFQHRELCRANQLSTSALCEPRQRRFACQSFGSPPRALARALKCGHQPQRVTRPCCRPRLGTARGLAFLGNWPRRVPAEAHPSRCPTLLQVAMWKETLTLGMLQKLRGIRGTFRRIC